MKSEFIGEVGSEIKLGVIRVYMLFKAMATDDIT